MQFDAPAARHLLRRIAFAPTPESLDAALSAGPKATVASALGLESTHFEADVVTVESAMRETGSREDLAAAWIYRILHTKTPLRELLALFWHNHFVSAMSKVEDGRLMADQIGLFREYGAGPFAALTEKVARDPAMVRYLDSEKATREHPNENFARELFELFTLGPGPYTESDIREAARAFTGYHIKHGRFHFTEAAHDDGEKTVLGARGRFRGEDIVRLAVEHSATPSFLAEKFACAFVTDHPSPLVVKELSALYRRARGNIGQWLADLFVSDVFFAQEHRFALTRSPVALVVAALRTTATPVPIQGVVSALDRMGQTLLDPPSVKGYTQGPAWMNPATLLARRTFLTQVGGKAKSEDPLPILAERVLGESLEPEVAALIETLPAEQRIQVLLLHPTFQRC